MSATTYDPIDFHACVGQLHLMCHQRGWFLKTREIADACNGNPHLDITSTADQICPDPRKIAPVPVPVPTPSEAKDEGSQRILLWDDLKTSWDTQPVTTVAIGITGLAVLIAVGWEPAVVATATAGIVAFFGGSSSQDLRS